MDDVRKEKIKYIFIDIEWNQTPGTTDIENREPIQMGVVAMDEDFQKVKVFSKSIRMSSLEKLNEETLRVSHTTRENIMMGKSEETVLDSFIWEFPKYEYLVVWTRETYDLLAQEMKKCGFIMRKATLIVLQNVLEVVAVGKEKKIGFEQALNCANIPYVPNFLHYSKHDANYLYQLFQSCYQQYASLTQNEEKVANLTTRKIHDKDCPYVKYMQMEHAILQEKSSVFQGFTVCKICLNRNWEEWNRLSWDLKGTRKRIKKTEGKKKTGKQKSIKKSRSLRDYPLTENNIKKICEHFHVLYRINNETVQVETEFERWMIYLKNGKVRKLFHENNRLGNKRQKMKYREEYHQQKLLSENFYDVISYIKGHDLAVGRRLKEKSRIDELFEKIEMELQEKREKELQREELVELETEENE